MITWILLGVNAVILLLSFVFPDWTKFYLGIFPPDHAKHHWWTWVTHMFTHAGVIHFGLNMLSLFVFGPHLEKKLGGVKYLLLYFVSGILAASIYFITGGSGPMVGASGAVYGILAAGTLFFPNTRVIFLLIPFYPVKIIYLFPLAMAWETFRFFTEKVPSIAHGAHLGGAAVGMLMAWVFKRFSETNPCDLD